MRVLIVTNMWPTPQRPAFGVFVRDQVEALQALGAPDLDLEVVVLAPGSYVGGAAALARRRRGQRFDIVHAHFGLTQWPALAVRAGARAVTLHGTDVRHPLSGRLTRAALRFADLVATASEDLARELPAPRRGQRRAVLPCGVATTRFTPRSRSEARARLGLDPGGRYLLFPADPERAGKRADRARLLAAATGATLLTAGAIDPEAMPWHVNAANAVVVPSDHEGFGLAVLEALACDVPVLATPTGIHPQALAGIDGTLCAPFDPGVWATTAGPHLAAADPRIAGRARADEFGAARMAERVLAAWRDLVGKPLDSAAEAS